VFSDVPGDARVLTEEPFGPIAVISPYRELSEAIAMAKDIWRRINLVNLHENILPTRPRADLLLTKGASHRIEEVALRKL